MGTWADRPRTFRDKEVPDPKFAVRNLQRMHDLIVHSYHRWHSTAPWRNEQFFRTTEPVLIVTQYGQDTPLRGSRERAEEDFRAFSGGLAWGEVKYFTFSLATTYR